MPGESIGTYIFSFTSILAPRPAVVAVVAVPTEFANATLEYKFVCRTATTSSSTSALDGYFYSLWTQNNAGATMNVNAGQYSLTWFAPTVHVVAGIGWNPGSAR
ncbi:hypothetical protein DXG01_003756 [Tephrocybe rancida]|nr:hypothetical protein DXG01_003756 [Tephrocybe rancida]